MTGKMTQCTVQRRPREKAGPGRWLDFSVLESRAIASFPVTQALPYAFDLENQTMVFSLHQNPRALLAEPFIFTAQRKDLHQIGKISHDLLNLTYGAPHSGPRPILVFSIGRTGSTLFNRLLACAVDWSVSEPDTISQLALMGTEFREMVEEKRRFLTWHALSPYLALAADTACAVKFRSQINGIAGAVADAFPTARYVFMLREMESWAQSSYRTFGIKPIIAANRLKEGLEAIAALKAAAVTYEIVHYEQVIAEPAATLARIVGSDLLVGRDMSAAVAAVMSRDAQAGTRLERSAIKFSPDGEAEWMQRFRKVWQDTRPARLIEELELAY